MRKNHLQLSKLKSRSSKTKSSALIISLMIISSISSELEMMMILMMLWDLRRDPRGILRTCVHLISIIRSPLSHLKGTILLHSLKKTSFSKVVLRSMNCLRKHSPRSLAKSIVIWASTRKRMTNKCEWTKSLTQTSNFKRTRIQEN